MNGARILWLVVLLAGPAAAQEKPWTFPELLQHASAAHPSVLAQRASADAAGADYESALWQRYPSPSLEAIAGGERNVPGTTSRLRLQQPLWTGGRISAGIDGSLSRKDASGYAVGEAQRELALRVAAAYVEAVRAQTREAQARHGVEEHQRLLELIGRRVLQEVSAPVDRDLARSRLYLAMNERSLASQQRASALTQLTQLAGRPIERVAAPDAEIARLPRGEEAALHAAMAASPSLARLAAEERAASADVDSRRAAILPQVALRLERDFGGLSSDTRLLLVLEAQPGAGLSAGSAVEAARARRRALEHQRAAALRELQERIGIDWIELRFARERLENAELSRRTAAAVFDSFTRQYTTGRKTWIDVMNAVRESTQAELAAADAQAQVSAATLRLAIATGSVTTAAP